MQLFQLSRATVLALCILLLTLSASLLNAPSTFAQNGAIVLSGRVTDEADGSPLPGIHVKLLDLGFPGIFEVAVTDSSGYYTVTEAINEQIPNLIPGTYQLYFESNGAYVAEYYDDTADIAAAAKLTLTLDAPTTGINAELVEGGQLRGKITNQDNNQPTSPTYLHVYTLDGQEIASYLNPDTTGVYTATGIPPGTYKVRVEPPGNDNFHVSAYYPNQLTFEDAALIEMTPGKVITDVDFSLRLGGQISGSVTSDTSGAVVVPEIKVYDEDGELFTNWRLVPFLSIPQYSIRNLPPGNFRLFFRDAQERHRTEYYDNQQTLEAATPITVTAGAVTTIDSVLAYIPRVSAIATSNQLTGVILLTLNFNPTPILTINGGQLWERVPTTPWADQETNSAPSIGLARRTEPGSPLRILVAAGAGYDAQRLGIYRSGDKGRSWGDSSYPTAQCDEHYFSNVAPSPQFSNKLYLLHTCIKQQFLGPIASTELLVSHDAAISWQNTNDEGITFNTVTQFLTSPTVADRLYLLNAIDWLQSNNAGAEWTPTDFPVEQLVLDAQDAAWLYGITFYDETYTSQRRGKRSEDGGATWVDWAQQPCTLGASPYTDKGNVQLMAHPTQTKTLFVRCDQGLYRSDNGGESWTQLEPIPGQLLAPDYGNPGRILWAKDDGLWASTDDGESWQVIMPNYEQVASLPQFPTFLPSVSANE